MSVGVISDFESASKGKGEGDFIAQVLSKQIGKNINWMQADSK